MYLQFPRDAKPQEQNMHKDDVRFEVIRAVTMDVRRLMDVYHGLPWRRRQHVTPKAL
jgi:hypothetical protein